MLESNVERILREGVEARGGMCLKWVSPGNPGVPDRIVLLRGKIYLIELKADGGRARIQQMRMAAKLEKQGFTPIMLFGIQGVNSFFASIA